MPDLLIGRREFILSCVAGTLAPAALSLEQPKLKFAPFNFVFVSDCHLAAGMTDNFMLLQESQLFLQDLVKQINLINPDFVIFGGDQIQANGDSDANWQLFLDIVQGLNCPWHFVLGESDILGSNLANIMQTYGRDWRGRGLDNDQPYWSCNPASGVHLIGLDTSRVDSTNGYLDSQQLEWLRQDISQQKDAFNILISHHPLLVPSGFEHHADLIMPQASAVQAILDQSNCTVFALSGHIHASKIQWQKNVLYIASPSLDIYPCAFRHISVQLDKIVIETHQVNYPALIKKAKMNLLNSNIASSFDAKHPENFVRLIVGTRLDQNSIVSLADLGSLEISKKSLFIH